jgi:hypothetical protein
MTVTTDLTYITAGLFTRFIPHTSAGEDAWRVMANQGQEAILSIHTGAVLAQLRAAGYKVAKAKKAAPITISEIDSLLAELSA